MVGKKSKRDDDRSGENDREIPDVAWLEDADNPWGVPVLDVRPVTQTMISSSKDPKYATNLVECSRETGTAYIGKQPPVDRTIETGLKYPIERMLAVGILFSPLEMEHKWALFYYGGEIICVRSWLREVRVVAQVEEHEDFVEVTSIGGTFGDRSEDPDWTERALDFLLRSHALGIAHPAPLPPGMQLEPEETAMWCMSVFGCMALFAAPDRLPWTVPKTPLRTHSLLHIAVACGEIAGIEAGLSAGVPVDLLAADGLAPLHWTLACDDPAVMALLLDHGSPVDVRSSVGVTPLMNAVQNGDVDKVTFLIDHGADVNARDRRGFTSLHRAAELGHSEVARMLLDRGATPDVEAQGHTPRSFAEERGEADVLAVLDEYDGK